MGKNVAVFVDVANIFYAAKAAGVDIDYVTLLKSAIAGRDFVRAYAYTGLDPDNENQRNFHNFLSRHDYKVVSKDIRKYGDGKVKANLDIELVVDMMKTARNLDVAIVVSGDGDFAPAIRAVQEMGVRVEVVSFRGNTSSDLIDVADQFTDIIQMAKVEKGSSRSGRRVADDGEDLSMTEVPGQADRGDRPGSRPGRRSGPGPLRRGRARAGRRERAAVGSVAPSAAGASRPSRRSPSRQAHRSAASWRCPARSCPRRPWPAWRQSLRRSPRMRPRPAGRAGCRRRRHRAGGRWPRDVVAGAAVAAAAAAAVAAKVGELSELGGVPIAVEGAVEAIDEDEDGAGRARGERATGPATGRLRIGLGLPDRAVAPAVVRRGDPVRRRR